MDEGLTFEELQELLNYIKKNYSWHVMYAINRKYPGRKFIKYIDFSVDTRTNDIWRVEFRGITNYNLREVEFRTKTGYNLKERIYDWLKDN